MIETLTNAIRNPLIRRNLVFSCGFLICIYALAVLFYALTVPSLGLATTFSTELNRKPINFLPDEGSSRSPQVGERVIRVGDEKIESWADLLQSPSRLRDQLETALHAGAALPWAKTSPDGDYVRVVFRAETGEEFAGWCLLGNLSL